MHGSRPIVAPANGAPIARIFYSQAGPYGGGGVSTLGPGLRKCENVYPLLVLKFDSCYSNTVDPIVKGLKMHFSSPLRLCYTAIRLFCDRAAAISRE